MYVNANLHDPDNPVVKAALTHKCACGAKPGEHCASTLPKPFPDRRLIHYMRVEKWDMQPGQRPADDSGGFTRVPAPQEAG